MTLNTYRGHIDVALVRVKMKPRSAGRASRDLVRQVDSTRAQITSTVASLPTGNTSTLAYTSSGVCQKTVGTFAKRFPSQYHGTPALNRRTLMSFLVKDESK